MAEINRPMLGQKSIEERSASTVSNQTSEYSSGNFSSHLNVSQGPRLTDSIRRDSGYGVGGIRQTEMKLKVAEIDHDLPPERMKDYKGRIRVSRLFLHTKNDLISSTRMN
ncbi:unnamed protein product [Phytophthora lilii]|uniref:Unnamed protein product n=1 Tax=Phytophthora lilii TaxID=2077276 RepID=A0A9W6UAR1_9STRA|nr:unnamed protein product [Phytophthora lilii]